MKSPGSRLARTCRRIAAVDDERMLVGLRGISGLRDAVKKPVRFPMTTARIEVDLPAGGSAVAADRDCP